MCPKLSVFFVHGFFRSRTGGEKMVSTAPAAVLPSVEQLSSLHVLTCQILCEGWTTPSSTKESSCE